MKKKIIIALIFFCFLSFLTRFFNLSYPKKVVFDETHFALYAKKYFLREYYFDIHPPFGKLFFATLLLFSPPRTDFDYEIGKEYPEKNYLILRGGVAFLGSVLPLLVYLIARTLNFSQKTAFLAFIFTIFENALLVQSRLILLDVILIFFGLLALYFSLLEKKMPIFSWRWFFLNSLIGLALGCAISTKLTGFGILVLIWFINLVDIHNRKVHICSFLKWKILLNFCLPFLVYIFLFLLHFSIAPKPCLKNCGAILNCYFEECIRGINATWTCALFRPPSKNLLFLFLKTQSLVINTNLSGEYHYFASPWFSFPFMIRPILYFKEKEVENLSRNIVFLGNPILWWGGFTSIICYLYLSIKKFLLKKEKERNFEKFYFLIAGFIFQWIPFVLVTRFVLLYHYLLPLLFSIIILAGFLVEVINLSNKYLVLFSLFVMLVFILLSPLSYGFPLPERYLRFYRLLPTWEF